MDLKIRVRDDGLNACDLQLRLVADCRENEQVRWWGEEIDSSGSGKMASFIGPQASLVYGFMKCKPYHHYLELILDKFWDTTSFEAHRLHVV